MGTKFTLRNGAKYTLTAHTNEPYADILEKIRDASSSAPAISTVLPTGPNHVERRHFITFTNQYDRPEMLFIDTIIGIEAT